MTPSMMVKEMGRAGIGRALGESKALPQGKHQSAWRFVRMADFTTPCAMR